MNTSAGDLSVGRGVDKILKWLRKGSGAGILQFLLRFEHPQTLPLHMSLTSCAPAAVESRPQRWTKKGHRQPDVPLYARAARFRASPSPKFGGSRAARDVGSKQANSTLQFSFRVPETTEEPQSLAAPSLVHTRPPIQLLAPANPAPVPKNSAIFESATCSCFKKDLSPGRRSD